MKIMLVMTNYAKNYTSPQGRLKGRLPWMKGAAGMLVVSLGGVNFGFWSQFGLVPRPHYSVRPKRFGSRGPNVVRLGYVTKVN